MMPLRITPPTLCAAALRRTLRFMYTTVEAAVTLHNRLLQHMLRLPKAFFDTNPAGAAAAGLTGLGLGFMVP